MHEHDLVARAQLCLDQRMGAGRHTVQRRRAREGGRSSCHDRLQIRSEKNAGFDRTSYFGHTHQCRGDGFYRTRAVMTRAVRQPQRLPDSLLSGCPAKSGRHDNPFPSTSILPIFRAMAKSPKTKRRRSGDALKTLEPYGFGEAPQAEFTGAPLTGSIVGLGRADIARSGRGHDFDRRQGGSANRRRRFRNARRRPTKSSGAAPRWAARPRPSERAAAGLNPVAGLDISLEDAELMAIGGVTATVAALSALIESGNPLHKNGEMWVPHRPARPDKSEGGVRHPDGLGLRAGRRPADRHPRPRLGRIGARPHPGPARRHRLGQDLHHGQGDRGDAAPGADPRPQQDAGRAALQRVQEVLPRQRGRVFRLLLRLLPARGLRAAHRHLHREGILDQRADRPHAPLGDALAAGARRRHHRRVGLLHLRYRLGRDLHRDDVPDGGRRPHRPARAARRSRRAAVQAPRHGFHARLVPRARRHDRDLPRPP